MSTAGLGGRKEGDAGAGDVLVPVANEGDSEAGTCVARGAGSGAIAGGVSGTTAGAGSAGGVATAAAAAVGFAGGDWTGGVGGGDSRCGAGASVVAVGATARAGSPFRLSCRPASTTMRRQPAATVPTIARLRRARLSSDAPGFRSSRRVRGRRTVGSSTTDFASRGVGAPLLDGGAESLSSTISVPAFDGAAMTTFGSCGTGCSLTGGVKPTAVAAAGMRGNVG